MLNKNEVISNLEIKLSNLNYLYDVTLKDLRVLYTKYNDKDFDKEGNLLNPIDVYCEDIIEALLKNTYLLKITYFRSKLILPAQNLGMKRIDF